MNFDSEPFKSNQLIKSGLVRGSSILSNTMGSSASSSSSIAFNTNSSNFNFNSYETNKFNINNEFLYHQNQQNYILAHRPTPHQQQNQNIDNDIFKFRITDNPNTIKQSNDLIDVFNNQYNQYRQQQIASMPQQQQYIFQQSDKQQLMSQQPVKRTIKKSRVIFSQWQINELEKLFKKQKYVTSNERDLMAKKLRLHPNQVKIWFQNRRYKIKKKNESNKE